MELHVFSVLMHGLVVTVVQSIIVLTAPCRIDLMGPTVSCVTRHGLIVLIVISISAWIVVFLINGMGLYAKSALFLLKDVLSVRT